MSTVLHAKLAGGWDSGPHIRKCTECGVRLWLPSDGEWTDQRAVWENPPPGYIGCGAVRPKDDNTPVEGT